MVGLVISRRLIPVLVCTYYCVGQTRDSTYQVNQDQSATNINAMSASVVGRWSEETPIPYLCPRTLRGGRGTKDRPSGAARFSGWSRGTNACVDKHAGTTLRPTQFTCANYVM